MLDNPNLKACIFMNLACLALTASSCTMKSVTASGVPVAHWQIFRGIFLVVSMALYLIYKQINPLNFASLSESLSLSQTLLGVGIRSFFGSLNLYLYYRSLSMISMSTSMVIVQTQAFWISIMGLIINKEKIFVFEIFGMLICFLAVVAITLCSQE